MSDNEQDEIERIKNLRQLIGDGMRTILILIQIRRL
jgi:hypothetical protein